ncbi:type II restriction enzyme [Neisseria perflava]|uniref:type II restriction endonuclease n=1 Tax=Neisseria perflava TaxID=33053 RepID=UPI00209DAD4F|nr:type II restriction endonuclease [Neisseria perflava]MCP1772053.1 type II restriction enzyme [Neisseria perflava]
MSEFETFIGQLSETNATLGYFTDFEKIRNNIKPIAIKLNQLNYLLGKSDLAEAIEDLYHENPSAFEVLGILVAVRNAKKTYVLDNSGQAVYLANYFTSLDKITTFIFETGLATVFQNKDITNLVDYVFGVEAGLDTNSRKNRVGTSMAQTVAHILKQNRITFSTEVPSTYFPKITSLGTDIKRFDFVIETNQKTYLIETNFYNSGGSKLNEVARAYSDIAPKINHYPEFEFVWITDGHGWYSAKNKLEEAFNIIPSLYNLTTLKNFIEKIKQESISLM